MYARNPTPQSHTQFLLRMLCWRLLAALGRALLGRDQAAPGVSAHAGDDHCRRFGVAPRHIIARAGATALHQPTSKDKIGTRVAGSIGASMNGMGG